MVPLINCNPLQKMLSVSNRKFNGKELDWMDAERLASRLVTPVTSGIFSRNFHMCACTFLLLQMQGITERS